MNSKSPNASASKQQEVVTSKLDLSTIAENVEGRKTYMTLTATAAARKEATTE